MKLENIIHTLPAERGHMTFGHLGVELQCVKLVLKKRKAYKCSHTPIFFSQEGLPFLTRWI